MVARSFAPTALTLALLGSVYVAAPASATTFSSTDISRSNALLSQFNVVVSGAWNDTTATSTAPHTIDGRAIIGGSANVSYDGVCTATNCSGNSSTPVDATGKAYGALTVFGNVTGSLGQYANATTSIGGNVSGYIGMNNTGTLNLKQSGAGATIYQPGTAINTNASSFQGGLYASTTAVVPKTGVALSTVFPFGTSSLASASAAALATGLAALPGSPGVKAEALPTGDSIFFTAGNDYTLGGKTYGVVTISGTNLQNETNFAGISNGTNAATFVIVTGSGSYTLPNLNSYADAGKVIFDFVNATTLNFAGNFNGTILAPLATINQNANGVLDGSIVVAALNQTAAITDSNMFVGDLSALVPEPASLTLLGLGAIVAGLARRRRKTPRTP